VNEDAFITLAIETSCDDTSAAVLNHRKVLANVVSSQEIHGKHGGVVPELASRAHMKNIMPVVRLALERSGLALKDLNLIAYTRGPGLPGSLHVGASYAKGLAMALGLPIFGVHHMRAHVLAHLIDDERHPSVDFPFLCLTVSGGHTQIIKVESHLNMEILGETEDDAAGEAFDKCARMLGFPYPGGPYIDRHAVKGNPKAFNFPVPKAKNLNFSFSGLKTSFLYFLKARTEENPDFIKHHLDDLCASLQYTIIKALMQRLEQASESSGINKVVLAGGVSANSGLRKALMETAGKKSWIAGIPPLEYCTDNAAMIGVTAYLATKDGLTGNLSDPVSARLDWSATTEKLI
jgi:N6-L-threonylcarbamoyladenine synthase